MTGGQRLALLVELALIAFLLARAAARRRARPGDAGLLAASAIGLPGLALLAGWALATPGLITRAVVAGAAIPLPTDAFARAAVLARARAGLGPLAAAYAQAQARFDWSATVLLLLLAIAGYAWARRRTARGHPPRPAVERMIRLLLALAALVAVLATLGILLSLLWESARFFGQVSPLAFALGTHWSPQTIDPADPGATLGAVPLVWGTFFIGGVIAMAVAVPLGLLSAIYLTHYARAATRAWLKPLLEVLAGVPSIVYGYVAALVVAPAVRRLGAALGDPGASGESALAVGLVLGIMIVPYVSSASDDALAAVPAELGDGSLALGATTAETVRRVLLPAALPGIAAGILLALSRAVGETVVVVMAASAVGRVSADPFAGATTVTRQIVDLLTGEATFDSPKTLAAFALGLLLFAVTLVLNLLAYATLRRARAAA